MKGNSISFHEDRRWTVSAAVAYAVLSLLLPVLVSFIGDRPLGRLITLSRSTYLYSVTMTQPTGQDDYLRFDAALGFARSPGANIGINAAVVMQATGSIYTEAVAWRAEELSCDEIAISGELAKQYGLNVGDTLYSRHVVDGDQHEYTIAQVLPYVSPIGSNGMNAYADGLIVMGYDARYAQNISHDVIVFSNETLEALTRKYAQTPVGIEYRDDAMNLQIRRLIPYLLLLIFLAAVLSAIFAWSLAHLVLRDQRRLIMLGFEKRRLDRSFVAYMIPPFALSLLCSALAFALVLLLTRSQMADLWFLSVLALTELPTFICASYALDRKAWRS